MSSSINQHPTFFYSQPREYQFSHDSVFLARWLSENIQLQKTSQALDLCSGCGIIGLDFLFHTCALKKTLPATFDFLEVQELYEPHHLLNLQSLREIKNDCRNIQSHFFKQNYNQDVDKKYDLIISNPPYFFKGQGTLSPSNFKNRCRFFLDSDYPSFLRFLERHLTNDGCAYFLMRSQEQHGIQIEKHSADLLQYSTLSKVTEIRGTPLFQLSPNSTS